MARSNFFGGPSGFRVLKVGCRITHNPDIGKAVQVFSILGVVCVRTEL